MPGSNAPVAHHKGRVGTANEVHTRFVTAGASSAIGAATAKRLAGGGSV
jgi:hypothetical protein